MNKICYVGTKNKVKLEAVKNVLTDYEVTGFEAKSNVSDQPKTDEEAIQGATNRALSLPKTLDTETEEIRIGLEAGVMLQNDILFLTNWGVLIDKDDNIYYAGGTRIPLPDFVKDKIFNEGLELATIMEEYSHINDVRSKQGAIGIFTKDLVKRVDIFDHIVKLLYGQYLFKKGAK